MTLSRARGALAAIAVAVLLPAGAQAQAPPGPPGPPPGNGLDLPSSPGTAPAFVPPGDDGDAPRRACRAGPPGRDPGRLQPRQADVLAAPGVPRERHGLGDRRPRRVARADALSLRGEPLDRAVRGLGEGCSPYRPSAHGRRDGDRPPERTGDEVVVHRARRRGRHRPKGFWTDGHLQCSQAGAPQAFLATPDFTTSSPTTISTRAWTAWYTASGGWHWLGVRGENAGRWDTWSATPTGVAQFHPSGAVQPTPWTWGPISVPTGQGIYAVGVFEIVLLDRRPAGLPVAVRQRRGDRRGGRRRGQPVLRLPLSP